MNESRESAFQEELEMELSAKYGPLISGDDLRRVLGYSSPTAFRQALARKTLPVPVFPIEHRRGKFAFVRDVAVWLAKQRQQATAQDREESDEHKLK